MNPKLSAPPTSSATDEAWGRLLLTCASLLALVALLVSGEAGLRAWDPGHLVRSRGLLVSSERYGWSLRPAVSAMLDGARYRINRRGYRGREMAAEAPRDATKRVVVLGDSVAFGLGVSDFETFPQILDSRDNGIEVVNLAVQGYGPDQQLLVLQDVGLRLEPDVVLVAFCSANDFADVMLSTSLFDDSQWKPRFRLAGDDLVLDDDGRGRVLRFRHLLADHSHLVDRLAGLAPRPRPSGAPDGGWHQRYYDAMRDEGESLRVTLAILRRMRELCGARGVRFVVAVFPHALGYRTAAPLVERLSQALTSESTRVVDVASEFRRAGLRWKHVALDPVGHLGPVGHALTADLLQRTLAEGVVAALDPADADGNPAHYGGRKTSSR